MSPRFHLLALAALASLAGAPQASAGSCCQSCASPCAPAVPWVAPRAYYSATQFYVVNEGPTFSGPGIITLPPNYYPYRGNDCCTDQAPVMLYQRHHMIGYPQVMSEEYYEGDYVAPPVYHGRVHHRRSAYRRHMRVMLPSEK
jgi:hypothetical protein